MKNLPPLPIDEVLTSLRTALTENPTAILRAEPGAGKTTRVPLSLLDSSDDKFGNILMLEPRRLAALGAAAYMSKLNGTELGGAIGYTIRGDNKTSPQTKIQVVTEGILTRMLQSDPSLPGFGVVIFDEFHERSIHADLGLALLIQAQATIRPDLKILVMSATLDEEGLKRILPDAPVIRCSGRAFPVEIKYRELDPKLPLEKELVSVIEFALRKHSGDLLVFLPGRGEIMRLEEWILDKLDTSNLFITPLYSEASFDSQKAALGPAPHGKRKIILATTIAETSLTIDGVGVVIDTGMVRTPRFDTSSGMPSLVTTRVSQASAEQRSGRAGRLGPGVAYRLWSESDHKSLPLKTSPEIQNADLTSFALEMALWGISSVSELSLIDPPSPGTITQSQNLLKKLGAIDSKSIITPHGREIAECGVHPRLAHMILKGKALGMGGMACDVAAILEDRDPLGRDDKDIDLGSRLIALEQQSKSRGSGGRWGRIIDQALQLRRSLKVGPKSGGAGSPGLLIALAYPDRIAKRRELGSRRYLLASGVGVELPTRSLLTKHEFLAVATLDTQFAHGRVFLAEPISLEEITRHFSEAIEESRKVEWNSASESVAATGVRALGAIVLEEVQIEAGPSELADGLLAGIKQTGLNSLPWSKESRGLQARSEWIRQIDTGGKSDWPDLSDATLEATMSDWLLPHLAGFRSLRELRALDLLTILKGHLGWERVKLLEELAPERLSLPSGAESVIGYEGSPTISVYLQEMFGVRKTPTIGRGKYPLTIELLSPAKRPLQVTKDLESFWKNSYLEVRKEMRGRYPKHEWPEDPTVAKPGRGIKSRRRS